MTAYPEVIHLDGKSANRNWPPGRLFRAHPLKGRIPTRMNATVSFHLSRRYAVGGWLRGGMTLDAVFDFFPAKIPP